MPVASETIPWPDPDTGPYRLRLDLDVVDGCLELVGFAISTEPPTALKLRSIRLAEGTIPLSGMVRAFLIALRVRWAPLVATLQPEVAEALRAPGRPRGRPRMYDDAHWAAVAEVYKHYPPAPVLAIAEEFGVSRSAARHWAERCRRKGLLPEI